MHPQLDNRLRAKLRLRHLELLDVLGDTLNIHRAAPRLNLSQPSTSKLLQEAEDIFRAKLFDRLPRGLRLTAAGEAALRSIRLILHGLGESVSEVHMIAAGAAGRVRVGTVSVAIPTLLGFLVNRLRSEMPDLVVTVVEGSNETLHAALERNELDLVLGRMTDSAGAGPLRAEPLYQEPVSLVVRKNHPLLKRRKLSIADLSDASWVLPPEFSPMRQQLDSLMVGNGLRPPAPKLETTSLLLAEMVLNDTDMVGAMPYTVAKHYKDKGLLAIVKLPVNLAMPPVGLIFNATASRSPVVEAFIGHLRKVAGDLGNKAT